ncbi:peptide chain release factor N(5)-glutamine methyltransferase [Yeosuana sp. MJ-SS3]|uniref:Release factor glutamine methyltransferase n=1 Tax=Gilvirhabdus luticola TaxID=3079858 RepID=A0ABU3UA82_9FLAO|nr:peptide chain release factor N(5)-glutamine methyltransferase [Yeosuana sp. MJ-SS3]MDU8887317.1 peptide chain release factor N(5)-glutamine methyltransferase [Yeosuana sp. MJ-SS3]
MILKDFQQKFHNHLDTIYGEKEVDSFFYLLTNYYLSLNRLSLVLEPKYKLDKKTHHKFNEALTRLKQQEPIQYIIGEAEFFGLKFKVNEHTLIPRPETEELVEWTISSVASSAVEKSLKILDIGTGTGCIVISLAKNLPNAKVYALDVSKEALKIAKKNAELNNTNIEFIEADILSICDSVLNVESKFDIIVSNPPYVRFSEKQHMKPNVLGYEPELALYVYDDNPLQFYRAITEFAVNNLNNKGKLFFEINQYLGNQIKQLLSDYEFSDIELKKDIFGKDRMVKCVFNK